MADKIYHNKENVINYSTCNTVQGHQRVAATPVTRPNTLASNKRKAPEIQPLRSAGSNTVNTAIYAEVAPGRYVHKFNTLLPPQDPDSVVKLRLVDSKTATSFVQSATVLNPHSNSITMSSHDLRNKSNKDNKGSKKPKENNKDSPSPKEIPGQQSSGDSPPQPPTIGEELTASVINHFTTHWETFKTDCLSDVTHLDTLLVGLETRVTTLETNYTGLTSRVDTLENKVKNVSNKTPGLTGEGQILDRIKKLEDQGTQKTAVTLPDNSPVLSRLQLLESKMDKLVDVSEDGEIVLKHPEFNEMRGDAAATREDVETLSGFMHLMSKEVRSLDHRATMNSAKLMKNTLIFGGVISLEGEDPQESLHTFLRNFLQIVPQQEDMWDVEKLGNGYKRWVPLRQEEIWFPAPIKAKCTETFANKVMNNSYKLGGKEDEEHHFKYYVRRSKPEAHRAAHDKYYNDVKHFKDKNKNLQEGEIPTTFYFNGERFFVNGEPVEEDVNPPTFRDMMAVTDQEQDRMAAFDFASGGPKDLKESSFQAYALNVTSVEDIDLAYMRVRQLKRYADHIMLAYRIKEGDVIKQGCAHDKEYYGDVEILKEIKRAKAIDVAVFVAREYGGIPLGAARFECIKEVARAAIENVSPSILSQDVTDPKRSFAPVRGKRRNRPNNGQRNPFRGRRGKHGGGGGGGGPGFRGRGGGWRGGARGGHSSMGGSTFNNDVRSPWDTPSIT